MAAAKDYYRILGVERNASLDDIKKVYRKLARKYHPDLNPGDKAAEERFKDINDAYAILGEPEKRKEYDRFGTAGPFGQSPSGARGRSPGGYGGGGGQGFSTFDFDFGDVFGDLFGTATGRGRAAARRGSDIVAEVEITLKEAFTGITRRMSYRREIPCDACSATGVEHFEACRSCRGSGKLHVSKGFFRVAERCSECRGSGRRNVRTCSRCSGLGKTFAEETVNVKIPQGVDEGSLVKLRGKGNAGVGGAPAGDLRLKVRLAPHDFFERKGDDIHLMLPITFVEAALGAKVDIPTIDGSTTMTIPPSTQGGQKFKLKGKGMSKPGSSGGGRGDMYVLAEIAVPKKLDKAAGDAVRAIEAAYTEDPRKGFRER
jgi:molecular chaperone DnaJ